ncbi:uncharacterized protein LOC124663235 [Lolium rigidum]|uniref:uncharacterized protein LOC124663235 n=1 Tax=Lolium rigidum TaxID=89674 RepID=UPI001F5D4172|nr:uncharacterized protein LOC124663235 [Lolium rigidum]
MADIPNGGRLPSILLARKPRFTDSRNDTTATAKSQDGYTMAVSFWMENPPDLSLFSIHCTKPPHDLSRNLNFSVTPLVVGADGPFVLLRACFYATSMHEYFLYKAGSPPSLDRIILSPDELDDLSGVREWGILGHGGDGHYLLAALRDAPSSESDAGHRLLAALRDGYQLRIYSSKTKSWSTRTLHNPCPGLDRVIPDKVITLGQEGLLAWVDLSHGLLVCDLLLLLLQHQDPAPAGAPVSCFIPLPEPLPGNRYKLNYPFAHTHKINKRPSWDEESLSPSWFRDLACVNGVLKFVEMENHPAPHPQNTEDNIIYDADLIMSIKCKPFESDVSMQLSSFRDAWRAVTWTRKLVWPLLPSSNFWRKTCAAHVADLKMDTPSLAAFRERYSAFPILRPEDGDDIIYLKSMVEPSDGDGWVAAIDIGNKELKAIGQYYLPDDFYYHRRYDPEHPFRASTLSRHLDIIPGVEVSACCKIPEASSSANHPSNTSIRVSEASSCKPRSKIQRLSEISEELKRIRDHQKSIQNHHICQVHPVKNYLPQQQKWGATPVYPLCPQDNNQVCAAPVYPSQLHGNSLVCVPPVYPSRLHENNLASQTCLNNYHGYPQQLSAHSPFAYGAYTGYGNYQEQWPSGTS